MPNSGIRISRTMDFAKVTTLNKTVQELHANLYPEKFKEFDEENIKAFFKRKIEEDAYFLLLEDNDVALGYAWIEIKEYKENPFKHGFHSVYIHQISIVETFQNKGYGTKLMEEIYQIARDHKIELIELDYWCENDKAKEFYRKQGFIKNRESVYKKL